MERTPIAESDIHLALVVIRDIAKKRLAQKGDGTFASVHEILGIITEEYHELIAAVTVNKHPEVCHELVDIAVACMLGLACIQGETVDW